MYNLGAMVITMTSAGVALGDESEYPGNDSAFKYFKKFSN